MADRKATRFQPDPLTVGYLDFKTAKEFVPTVVGIVLNESYTGCALVVASDLPIKLHTKVRIKVGVLGPMKGEVVWTKTLEENIQKIGVKLLE